MANNEQNAPNLAPDLARELALALATDADLLKTVSQAEPFWVWSKKPARIIWANQAGLDIWGAEHVGALAARRHSPRIHGVRQLDEIAGSLAPGMTRLARLRFFPKGRETLLTCQVTGRRLAGDRLVFVTVTGARGAIAPRETAFESILSILPGPALMGAADGTLVAANAKARSAGFSAERSAAGAADLAGLAGGRGQQSLAAPDGSARFEAERHPLPAAGGDTVALILLHPAAPATESEPVAPQPDQPHKGPPQSGADGEADTDANATPDPSRYTPGEPGAEGQQETNAAPRDVMSSEAAESETDEEEKPALERGENSADKVTETPPGTPEPETPADESRSGAAALVAAVNSAFGGPNIVPFEPQNGATDESGGDATGGDEGAQLNETERDAFQAIADALGARLEGRADENRHNSQDQPRPEDEERNQTVATEEPAPDMPPAREEDDHRTPDQAEIFALLGRFPIPVFIYRGDETGGQPLFASRAFLKLLGYGGIEHIERAGGVNAVLPKTEASAHRPDDDTTAPGADTADTPMYVHGSSGIRIPVQARLQTIDWCGRKAMLLILDKASAKTAAASAPPAQSGTPGYHELQAILDTALDAFLIVDTRGVIKSCNQGAVRLFARDRETLRDMPFTQLIRDPGKQQAEILFSTIRDGLHEDAEKEGCEIVAQVPQGSDIPLFLKFIPIESAGKTLFCAIFSDITRWKAVAADQQSARERAEQDNEEKSAFLARISHEIRTPLNSIIGFSEAILENRLGDVGPERYRDYVASIRESGTYVLTLINDLLDLSKISAGKMELDFTNVNLNEIASDCIKLMQPEANKARIIIRSDLAPSLADIVADRRSLRQICLNLLSNAIKFTGASGQVIISTRMNEAGEIQLRIHDTGPGMDRAELDIAMEPFQRLENNTSTDAGDQGTGLGLPLTRALAEENRARFDIQSNKGHGTLVEITFPVNRVLAD